MEINAINLLGGLRKSCKYYFDTQLTFIRTNNERLINPFQYENAQPNINESFQIKSATQNEKCSAGGHIILKSMILREPELKKAVKDRRETTKSASDPIFTITKDGVYIFTLEVSSRNDFTANVIIDIKGSYGYLSAADWPLLPFYGIMCLVYVLLGVIWLTVSFLQWRDLLRIQFWIGGVILLGMLEKAMFYAEYQSLNSEGSSLKGIVLLAEWVSCAKRTLARMLVIIVSLGFGVVK